MRGLVGVQDTALLADDDAGTVDLDGQPVGALERRRLAYVVQEAPEREVHRGVLEVLEKKPGVLEDVPFGMVIGTLPDSFQRVDLG